MNVFFGVFRYEFRMSIRRLSVWLTFGILMVPYLTSAFTPPSLSERLPAANEVISYAGTFSFMLNLFTPVIAGILIADRLVRDRKLGVDELLHSTALPRWAYIAGKYFGALLSIAAPILLCSLLFGLITVASGAPLALLPAMALAFLGINLPALAFITAFSLACPLIMPVRVYQVLFTGYWFWGNFLSPRVLPTLNGTYLSASGVFAMNGLFGGVFGGGGPVWTGITGQIDALLNYAVLAACSVAALFVTERYLAWRANQA